MEGGEHEGGWEVCVESQLKIWQCTLGMLVTLCIACFWRQRRRSRQSKLRSGHVGAHNFTLDSAFLRRGIQLRRPSLLRAGRCILAASRVSGRRVATACRRRNHPRARRRHLVDGLFSTSARAFTLWKWLARALCRPFLNALYRADRMAASLVCRWTGRKFNGTPDLETAGRYNIWDPG